MVSEKFSYFIIYETNENLVYTESAVPFCWSPVLVFISNLGSKRQIKNFRSLIAKKNQSPYSRTIAEKLGNDMAINDMFRFRVRALGFFKKHFSSAFKSENVFLTKFDIRYVSF